MRDTQQYRVYNAERAAFGLHPIGRTYNPEHEGIDGTWPNEFPAVADAQAYVDAARNHPDIRARYGRSACRAVEVYFHGRGASGGSTRIRLGNQSRNKYVALHELAHTIETRVNGNRTAAHGAQFCGVLLHLAKAMMPENYEKVRAEFDKAGVKYNSIGLD